MRSHKLVSLQYIRAVGAILVVLWHTGWTRSVLGQSGVDLFFVVSGFVMMLVSGRENSPVRFGLARIARIAPLYWVVTLIVALMSHPPLPKVVASALFWPVGPFPVVLQGWSLNLEMAYYALFAVALCWPRRWRVRVLAVELVLLCIVLPAVLPSTVALNTWSNPLGFEFLTGAALYTAWSRGLIPTGARAWRLLLAGAATLLITHWLGDAPAGWLRVLIWGMPALAIAMGSLGVERSGQLPRLRLLEQLGEASYSIYLTHFVLLGFVSGWLHHLWAPAAVSIDVLLACAVGWGVHRLCERPLVALSKSLMRVIWSRPVSSQGPFVTQS